MSISVQCPGCEKNLRTKDELAGKRIKCPACGQSLVVPRVHSAPVQPGPTTPLPSKSAPLRRQEQTVPPVTQIRPVRWPWYAGGGAAALCVLVAMVFIFAIPGKDRTPAKNEMAAVKPLEAKPEPEPKPEVKPKPEPKPEVKPKPIAPKADVTLTALGANTEELNQRFGKLQDTKPSSEFPGATDHIFVSGNMKVIATMFKGKCGAANFVTIDDSELPASAIEPLLAANSDGLQWKPLQTGGSPTWLTRGKDDRWEMDQMAIWPNNKMWQKNLLSITKLSLLPERAKTAEPEPEVKAKPEAKPDPKLEPVLTQAWQRSAAKFYEEVNRYRKKP